MSNAAVAASIRTVAAQKRVSMAALGSALINRGGVSRQYLERLLVEQPNKITVADVLDLASKLGPELLQDIADRRRLGFTVRHSGAVDASSSGPLSQLAVAQMRSAEATMTLAQSLEDGVISPSESTSNRRAARVAAQTWEQAAAVLGEATI